MPVCNMCGKHFDVEEKPGALMFGHPSTVKEAVPVWKAHICQVCEELIVEGFKNKPIAEMSKMKHEAESDIMNRIKDIEYTFDALASELQQLELRIESIE